MAKQNVQVSRNPASLLAILPTDLRSNNDAWVFFMLPNTAKYLSSLPFNLEYIVSNSPSSVEVNDHRDGAVRFCTLLKYQIFWIQGSSFL